MASTYSTNLAIQLMGTGDQAGTWGTATNTNLGTLIEQAISGYVTQTITDGADTTISIPDGASGVARNMYIELTGTLTGNRNLIVPPNKKLYFIYNHTDGGYDVTVKVAGQTGVSVIYNTKVILVSNGTDIVAATTPYVTSPGGSTTQVQYNNGGVFGGTGLTYASSTGQYAFAPPTSGTAVTVNGLSSNVVRDINIVRTTSADAIQNAPNLTLSDGTAANEWTMQAGAGILGFWNYDGAVWAKRLSINNGGNVSVATPNSGYSLTVSGSTAFLNCTDGTQTFGVQMGGSATQVGTTSSNGLWFRTNNTDRVKITNIGGTTFSAPDSGPGVVFNSNASTTPVNIGTITTSLTIDCYRSNVFYTTLTTGNNVSAVTLNNPTDGQTVNIFVTQPASGTVGTMAGTWAKWPGGVAGTLTATLGAVDLIVATYRNSVWYATISKGFA